MPVLVLFLLHPDIVNSSHGRLDVLRSFLSLPQEHLPLLPLAWTLVYEIFFDILFSAGLGWLCGPIYSRPWAVGRAW